MIYPKVVLAGLMVVLTCLASGAEPLKIGMVATLTGPAAEFGRYQTQGAKLAAEEVNKAGGVLGRPIELVIEDSQSTNPGSCARLQQACRGQGYSRVHRTDSLAPRSTPWRQISRDSANQ